MGWLLSRPAFTDYLLLKTWTNIHPEKPIASAAVNTAATVAMKAIKYSPWAIELNHSIIVD